MNKQEKQTEIHKHRQWYGSYQREEGWGMVKVKGGKYMGTEDDLTLGGGHTMQHIAHVS